MIIVNGMIGSNIEEINIISRRFKDRLYIMINDYDDYMKDILLSQSYYEKKRDRFSFRSNF